MRTRTPAPGSRDILLRNVCSALTGMLKALGLIEPHHPRTFRTQFLPITNAVGCKAQHHVCELQPRSPDGERADVISGDVLPRPLERIGDDLELGRSVRRPSD